MSAYGYGLLADAVPLRLDAVQAALHDRAAVVRAAALDAAQRAFSATLAQPAAPALVAPVSAALADPDPAVRGRAAIALAAVKERDDALVPLLLRAYGAERDRDVRWHLAWALRRGFARSVPLEAIRAGLADADETARIEWVACAAGHRDAALSADLAPLVHDPSWRVAEHAAEALAILAGASPTAHLTAVPAGVTTPPPQPEDTTAPLPRPSVAGPLARPRPADARLDIALHPATAAALDAPADGPHPRVRLSTSQGTVVLRLYPEWAPLTSAAFLNLVDRGLLDGRRWFRIVPDFVTQTGDIGATNDGEGAAPYTLPAEENPLQQRAGIVAMGMDYRDGRPIRDSAGTQFYLTLSPQLHLDRDFSVFGAVERGFDVLGRLLERDTIVRADRLPDD